MWMGVGVIDMCGCVHRCVATGYWYAIGRCDERK